MKIQFLKDVSSIAELKKTYQKLCFKHHPDRGGNTETMQIINAEYDFLLKNLIDQEEESEYSEEKFWQSKEQQTEVEQVIHAKIQEIIGANLDGIKIEIIGVWIWLSGDTKAHKEKLKELGFSWNPNHKKWSFAGKKSQGWSRKSINHIRKKYGSQSVKNEKGEQAESKKADQKGSAIPNKAKLA